MTISRLSGKNRLKPGYGVLLILGLVAAVFLMNLLLGGFMALGLPFTCASILFWVFCVALLGLVFQHFGLVYRYDIDGVKLIVVPDEIETEEPVTNSRETADNMR